MIEAILGYLLQNIPFVAVLLVVIYGVWKLSKYHTTLENTKQKVNDLPCPTRKQELDEHKRAFEGTKQKVDDLPCSVRKQEIDEIKKYEGKFQKLNETVISTNDMVAGISKWVMKLDDGMIDKLAIKQSPLKLTDIGEDFLVESFGKDTIDRNLDFFISEMEKENPMTPYDVEDKSLETLLKNTGNEIFNNIKNYVYYSPDKIDFKGVTISISLSYIIRVMSVYLRDKYFEKYPEIEKDDNWIKEMNK